MKKLITTILIAALVLTLFAGCSNEAKSPTTIKIGASITPHADILKVAKDILAEQGIILEIIEFVDYVQPNTNVENGELDANYFQHQPYLDQFNIDNGTHLVSIASIHYEPFGIYAGKTASIADLQDGATIAIPNDGTNEARALILLEAEGIITLKEDAGFNATILDIADNPKNLTIKELEAAQLTLSLKDVDLAVINGNFAIQAGLNAKSDALATEDEESISATTYANVLCVKEGNENDDAIKALAEVLKGDEIKQYIIDTFQGAVVPIS